jgi:hypothetical protein
MPPVPFPLWELK